MTFTTKNTGTDAVELTIELSAEDLKRYVRETEQAYASNLSIDGFRKGKVPEDLVRKEVGEAAIREAALQTAMQRSLGQIIAEQRLDVLDASNLAVKENSAEKLIYTVGLKLFPSVTLPHLEEIMVPRQEVAVDPKEIDETIESIKASRAVLTETDAPAVSGDRVEVDFEVKDDGTTIEGGVSKNHPVTIGDKRFIPGFEEQLVGMKKGDHKEFSLEVPKDFSNKSLAGKKLDFDVTVQDVKKVALPEFTDQFAQTLGKFDNIDQLILNIKDGLMEEKKEKERQRLRLAIINAIVEKTTCTVPPAMIDEQVDLMIANFDRDLHQHDMELNMYLAKLGKTRDDIRKEWRPEAERQVRMALVLHVIARDRDIAVEPEELDQAVSALTQSVMAQGGAAPAQLDIDRIRANVQSKLLNEKTLEFLERTCTAK